MVENVMVKNVLKTKYTKKTKLKGINVQKLIGQNVPKTKCLNSITQKN